jgi:hypothetical protein
MTWIVGLLPTLEVGLNRIPNYRSSIATNTMPDVRTPITRELWERNTAPRKEQTLYNIKALLP